MFKKSIFLLALVLSSNGFCESEAGLIPEPPSLYERFFTDAVTPSFSYQYFWEPFLNLDAEARNVGIFECSTVEEGRLTRYMGLGSCLIKNIPLMRAEDNQKKVQILIHAYLPSEEGFVESAQVDFKLTWGVFGLNDLVSSFSEKNLHPFSNEIILEASPPQALPEALRSWLIFISGPSLKKTAESFDLPSQTKKIKFGIQSLSDNETKLMIHFLDDKSTLYTFGMITDYGIGAEKFFFMSEDQYQQSHKKSKPAALK